MQGISLQLRIWQDFFPREGSKLAGLGDVAFGAADFERTAVGEISLEVRRVDFDAANRTCRSEPHNAPIVPQATASTCLPPVVQSFSSARQNLIVARGKEHVARVANH